jgi:WD40 repeat protein
VRMWDVKTRVGTPLEGHESWVNSVAISPDGTKIASGSYDKTIRLWSVKSQAPIGKPIQGRSDVTSVAFSHNGAFIVSGFDDGIIQLWNVETGAKFGDPLRDHTDRVTSVACSPNSIHIASGSLDRSVRLWNMGDILVRDAMGRAHGDSHKSKAYTVDDMAIVAPPAVNQHRVISYSHPDAATQYPLHLFPNQTFTIRDGWILGPNDELLLWVPPAHRSDLLTPSSKSHIMGVTHPTELDFSNFKCGTEWMQCCGAIDTE